jgi:hypothetical protein
VSAGDPSELTTEQFARWWNETGEHELRQILYWRWDPIGVSDNFPNTADEYDGYAPQVVQALRKGGSPEEFARALSGFEHDAMGLGGIPLERLEALSSLLVEWYENSQASWADFGPVRR